MEDDMNMLVADVLRSKGNKVEIIAPGATILEAVKRMTAIHIGCLVVVSKTGRLAGILSERDCMWKIVAEQTSLRKTLVKDTMTPARKMTTVTLSHTVDDCMNLMTSGHYRHLPVMDGTKLIGIVSIGDAVKSQLDDQRATIKSLEKYIEGSL